MNKISRNIFLSVATIILLLHSISFSFHSHIEVEDSKCHTTNTENHSSTDFYDLLAHLIHGELDHDHLIDYNHQDAQQFSQLFIAEIQTGFSILDYRIDIDEPQQNDILSFAYTPPPLRNYTNRGPPSFLII
jgi:hypothetical protein